MRIPMQVSKSIATNLRIGLNRFHNQKTSPFVGVAPVRKLIPVEKRLFFSGYCFIIVQTAKGGYSIWIFLSIGGVSKPAFVPAKLSLRKRILKIHTSPGKTR